MKKTILTEEDFKESVANHTLTIHQDDGVFRHLVMQKDKEFHMKYEITTWPGYLCISGDMGCFVFQRLKDMFEFHRKKDYTIDFYYWAQKVQAGDVRRFSTKVVAQHLTEDYEYLKEDALEKEKFDENIDLNCYIRRADDVFSHAEACDLLNELYKEFGSSFEDYSEYDFTEFTFHFIWCCYAVCHAIKEYDAVKTANLQVQ